MSAAALLGLTAWLCAQPAPTQPAGAAPSNEEVDALIAELDRQAKEAEALSRPPVAARAAEPGPMRPSLPAWADMVVPVASLRLRPTVLLGHPGAQAHPQLRADVRGMVGFQMAPTHGVTARVVLSVHPTLPQSPGLGQDALLDAWLTWAYRALGGELLLRAGRQEVDISDLVAAPNMWLQRAPRLDGLRARLAWSQVFAQAWAGVEVPPQVTAPLGLATVNGLAALQAGFAQGEGRLVEGHVLMWQRNIAVQGDASTAAAAPTRLDVGGHAQWHLWGLRALAALDVQQGHFEPPSLWAPAGAWHASGGYAPHWAWAFGAYAEVGTRGAWNSPGTYAPNPVGNSTTWDGVRTQTYDPMWSTRHGALGEMDLLSLQNAAGFYGRVGLVREGLRNLSLTLWRLMLLDPRAGWNQASGQAVLRPGEGVRQRGLGWEVDLSAHAELTQHIQLTGAVGMLVAEPQAQSAFFSRFAQTGWVGLECAL